MSKTKFLHCVLSVQTTVQLQNVEKHTPLFGGTGFVHQTPFLLVGWGKSPGFVYLGGGNPNLTRTYGIEKYHIKQLRLGIYSLSVYL